MKRCIRAAACAAGAALSVQVAAAGAADYPSRPVRVIVSLSAGSGGDIATRTITPRLSEVFGHQFIVDNRVGFSGNIGAEMAARATPDGHTLLVVYAGNAISQSYHAKLGYRLDSDFAPIGQFASVPLALVIHPGLGAKTLTEFVALVRSRPKHYHYASPGNGSLPHLAAQLLRMQSGIDIVHVPYKGTTTAVAELLGGQTAATFAAIPTALSHVESGQLRMLGISSAKRSTLVPGWPTIAESGLPGFDVSQWYGLVAPAGTPRNIVERLSRELATILRNAETRDMLTKRGIDPIFGTSESFAGYIKVEIAKWAKVVKAAGEEAH